MDQQVWFRGIDTYEWALDEIFDMIYRVYILYHK